MRPRSLFDTPSIESARVAPIDPTARANCLPAEGCGGSVRIMSDAELRAYCDAEARRKFADLTRYVAAMPSDDDRRAWLAEFAKHHGTAAAQRLRESAWDLIQAWAA